jgi:NTE family protein
MLVSLMTAETAELGKSGRALTTHETVAYETSSHNLAERLSFHATEQADPANALDEHARTAHVSCTQDIGQLMTTTSNGTTAIVLAGGVAKGAFEAGAIQVLVEHGIKFAQVVGTSSGALNAILLAAAIRANRERESMAQLLGLWREEASWMRVFHFTIRDALRARALSDSTRLLHLMRTEIPLVTIAAVNPVRLHLVVTAIDGVIGQLGTERATTFEGVCSFEGSAFDDEAGRERIYAAATASAAFPVVFRPVELEGIGPCYDGAVVNDTPLKLAIDGGADRVVVIAPYPAEFKPAHPGGGLEMIAHLVDMLTHERLYRDLQQAEKTNRSIEQLRELVRRKELTEGQLETILRQLNVRPIEVVTIRPPGELAGNSFAGFADRKLREAYLAAGQEAAHAALPSLRR